MSHLDEGTIHAWLDGALPPEEAARVEAHATECAECAALVAEARGFIAGASRIVSSLDVVRGNVLPAAAVKKPATQPSIWKKLNFTPARAAIAATILVGVASMFSLRRQDNQPTSPLRQFDAASPTSAPVAVPASAPAPAAPAQSNSGLNPAAERIAAQRQDSAAKPPALARSEAARDAIRDAAVEQPKAILPAAPSAASAASASNALAGAGVALGTAGASPVAAPAAADARAAKPSAPEPSINAFTRAAKVAGAIAPSALAREQNADSILRRAVRTAVGETPLPPEGCYAIVPQTSSPDLHGFPTQFQLTRDSANRPIVRPTVFPGQFDRPVEGASWQVLPGNSVAITVVSARGGRMDLQFSPGDTVIRVTDAERGFAARALSNARPSLPIRFATRSCER